MSAPARWKVLVTCPPMQLTLDEYRAELQERGVELVAPRVVQQFSEERLIELIADVHGVIAGDDPFSERVIAAADKLAVLIKWGIGIDSIDVDALTRRGIAFSNTPGVFADEVADVALGYVLMLARQLQHIHDGVRAGGWPKPAGRSLRGLTLGVIGLGSIGQAIVRRGIAFGLKPLGYDPVGADTTFAADVGLQTASLELVVSNADFLVLCCALTRENRGLLNRERIALMKRGSYLVNVARGPLVDEAALAEALASQQLAGAALDVFVEEPLPADHPFRRLDNCIFGSHNASNSRDAVARVNRIAIEKLMDALTAVSV